MNHLKQSPHTNPKRPTRSWSALLWAGLLALGSTPAYQAVHAVESFLNKDEHPDDFWKQYDTCLEQKDFAGCVDALNMDEESIQQVLRGKYNKSCDRLVQALDVFFPDVASFDQNSIQKLMQTTLAQRCNPLSLLSAVAKTDTGDRARTLKIHEVLKPTLENHRYREMSEYVMTQNWPGYWQEVIKWAESLPLLIARSPDAQKSHQGVTILLNQRIWDTRAHSNGDLMMLFFERYIRPLCDNEQRQGAILGMETDLMRHFLAMACQYDRLEEFIDLTKHGHFWMHESLGHHLRPLDNMPLFQIMADTVGSDKFNKAKPILEQRLQETHAEYAQREANDARPWRQELIASGQVDDYIQALPQAYLFYENSSEADIHWQLKEELKSALRAFFPTAESVDPTKVQRILNTPMAKRVGSTDLLELCVDRDMPHIERSKRLMEGLRDVSWIPELERTICDHMIHDRWEDYFRALNSLAQRTYCHPSNPVTSPAHFIMRILRGQWSVEPYDLMRAFYDTHIHNIMKDEKRTEAPSEDVTNKSHLMNCFLGAAHSVDRLEEFLDHMKGHEMWEHAAGWNEGEQEEDNELEGPTTKLIKSYIQEAKDRIQKENKLIAKLPDQRLNLRDLVLAQERSHAARPKVPYSKEIEVLSPFTRGLSNDIIKIKIGDRYLPLEMLRLIDSYLLPDPIINAICTKQGPTIRQFVREQCARVLPGQAVPETCAEQIDVLVREFQRLYPRAQRNDQQPEGQHIEQQVLALTSSEHQQEESKDNNPAREQQ